VGEDNTLNLSSETLKWIVLKSAYNDFQCVVKNYCLNIGVRVCAPVAPDTQVTQLDIISAK